MKTISNIRIKTLAVVTFAAFMTGCYNEEVLDNNSTNGEELELTAGSVITIPADAVTRAGNSAEVSPFTKKDFDVIVRSNNKEYVFQKMTAAKTTEDLTDKDITVEGTTLNPAKAVLDPILYWNDLGGRTADLLLVGVHPQDAYKANQTDDLIAWSVEADQSQGVNPSDLLLARNDSYKWTGRDVAANLNFQHVCAMITLNIKKGTNYEGTFATPVVTVTGAPMTGKVNILTNEFTVEAGDKKANIIPTTLTGDATKGYTCEVIVIPTELAKDEVIATVTVDGNTYNVKAPTSPTTNIEAGKNNVFNVTISKSPVSVSATITKWGENKLDVTSQLVEVAPIEVDAKITEGSIMKVTFNNGTTDYNVSYTATQNTTDNKLYWEVTTNTKPLYWEDIDLTGGKKLTAQALLTLGTTHEKVLYDNIYTSKTTDITMTSKVTLTEFKHPLSLIIVKVQTTTDGDKVELFPTTGNKPAVTLPQHLGYTGKVDDKNGTNVVYSTSPADLLMTDITETDTTTETGTRKYALVISPMDIDSKDVVYISVKIGYNTYEVKTKETVPAPAHYISYIGNESYIYTLTIKKTGINASATIVDWGEQTFTDDNVTLD